MIAALQQIPLGALGSEWDDETEGGGVINSYLDECWKSHPTRQQKMKKNLPLANQTLALHMNSKNMRNHNHGFNNNYIWNMNYSWTVHPIQWRLRVWGSVNIMAYMCYLPASFSMGCWHGGEREKHRLFLVEGTAVMMTECRPMFTHLGNEILWLCRGFRSYTSMSKHTRIQTDK